MGFEQQIKIEKDGQTSFIFKNEEEKGNLFEEERKKVAKEFGILNLEKLTKEKGEWYFDGLKVEEYSEFMSDKDPNPYSRD